jgi:hypothetical protein
MFMNKPFEYIESLEPIPVDEGDFKILKVANMIPLFVEYEHKGHKENMVAHIDYETQNIVVEGVSQNPDFDLEEFNQKILHFLKLRGTNYAINSPLAPQDKFQNVVMEPIRVPARIKEGMEEIINARENEPGSGN